MKMKPVESSNIAAVGHEPETNTLRIEFKNGGIYEYDGFTEEEMTAFGAADSVGKYYSAYIRKNYESRKLDPALICREGIHHSPETGICEKCRSVVDPEMPFEEGQPILCGGDVCDGRHLVPSQAEPPAEYDID